MTGIRLSVLFAALAIQAVPVQAALGTGVDARAADSALLAEALSGPVLQLTMRGTTVAVQASAVPAEDGCSALVAAHVPGMTRKWSRLFRWSEIAWAGTTPEGATMVSFFEHEGRLPSDRLVFTPLDGAAFSEALARVASSCRAARGEGERILTGGRGGAQGCYFARLPGLELLEGAGLPPRAMMTVLAHETPEAELQLMLERGPPDRGSGGDDWGRTEAIFTFAHPRLKDLGVADARVALDGKPFVGQQSLAIYSETRARLRMDPFKSPAAKDSPASFSRRLAASSVVSLSLLDSRKIAVATLTFDTAPPLAAARRALAASDWSCGGAAPEPVPAAIWKPAEP